MKALKTVWFGGLVLMGALGCSSPQNTSQLDTPTSGSIAIAADESLRPLVEAEVASFEATYPNAHIRVYYLPESEAINGLLLDSFRLVISTRRLSQWEDSIIKHQSIYPHDIKIAYDGLAMIVHPSHSLDSLDQSLWLNLLSGKENRGALVFEHSQSSSIRFVRDRLMKGDSLPNHFNALNNNRAVIDYISAQSNAIGLIGLSWISDKDDTVSNSFLSKVKVLALQAQDGEYYQPYQAYLAQNVYPLRREVYVLSREARAGLGSGLMSYMAGDKGQRIVLKSGLVPATMPIRLVQFTEQPL